MAEFQEKIIFLLKEQLKLRIDIVWIKCRLQMNKKDFIKKKINIKEHPNELPKSYLIHLVKSRIPTYKNCNPVFQ